MPDREEQVQLATIPLDIARSVRLILDMGIETEGDSRASERAQVFRSMLHYEILRAENPEKFAAARAAYRSPMDLLARGA